MTFSNFEFSTYNHYVDTGYEEYALSVFCLPGHDGDEICHRCPALRNDKYRESTVGEVRAAGYEVVPAAPPPGHALIKLPPPSSEEENTQAYWREHWKKLNAVFGEKKDNPAAYA